MTEPLNELELGYRIQAALELVAVDSLKRRIGDAEPTQADRENIALHEEHRQIHLSKAEEARALGPDME